MFVSECSLRVRYGETDQMGYVYYGHYAHYFEVARVEALRTIGMSYKEMETSGIMLPVTAFSIKYFKPAFYDDLLTIKTTIVELPKIKITFKYDTYNEAGLHLNTGETTLVFISKESGRPIIAPDEFIKKLSSYFQSSSMKV